MGTSLITRPEVGELPMDITGDILEQAMRLFDSTGVVAEKGEVVKSRSVKKINHQWKTV